MTTIKHDTRYPLFFIQPRGGRFAVVAARYSEHGIPLGATTVALCDTHEQATTALGDARREARAAGDGDATGGESE
jgi:hypothetical protein